MFSDNYIALCAKNGEHVTAVAEKLGFSRSAGIKWVNGSVPRKSTLKRIADYFGVTVDELINEKPSAPNEDFPEVTMIGRASKKMSQADREKMLQLIRIAFPEAFDD